ncbi:hypothetical protein H2200_011380 [Cladophialophora chaetospira]|uniref:Uncharacterized protein n=1 Tax=Cladophialophora chaetospira TaxID=386627 RepID=A0AA39CD35_9EURO|nr:hypothetical protein H2200_011380 [Cladophialophora chaetospira]
MGSQPSSISSAAGSAYSSSGSAASSVSSAAASAYYSAGSPASSVSSAAASVYSSAGSPASSVSSAAASVYSSATNPAASVSSAAEKVFSSATSSARESPAAAAATAYAAAQSAKGFSYATVGIISLTGILTTLVIIAASIYFSGYGDDVAEWFGKRYYKAKAIAEVKVMENVGEERVQSELKDSLKKNPLMGEGELEQVSGGLGKEASQQGLGSVNSSVTMPFGKS